MCTASDPDPSYPLGIPPYKRLPDWIPGEGARADVTVPWIIVDRAGRRYMNEYPPYTQDTSWRAMATYDPQSMSYLRIPSYLVMDEPGRAGYPIVSPTFNDRRFKFEWSEKTLRDLEARMLRKADSVAGLAAQMGVAEMSWRARSPTGTRLVMAGVTACMAAQRPRWCG